MKTLIAYATNSGGTREVAELIASVLERSTHAVVTKSVRQTTVEELDAYGLVIFGSCTWELITPAKRFEGQLQEHFIEFKDKLKGKEFVKKRFAIFGLGDSTYTNFCIAANLLEALVKQIKGTQVGPTLRVDRYFFDQENNEQKIQSWAQSLTRELATV